MLGVKLGGLPAFWKAHLGLKLVALAAADLIAGTALRWTQNNAWISLVVISPT